MELVAIRLYAKSDGINCGDDVNAGDDDHDEVDDGGDDDDDDSSISALINKLKGAV